jgi:hypothetical protein
MSTRVAIAASYSLEDSSLLKRAALMFDHFVVDIDHFTSESVLADLRWLADRGVVFDTHTEIKNELGDVLNLCEIPPNLEIIPPQATMLDFMLRFFAYHVSNTLGWTAVVLGRNDPPNKAALQPGADRAVEIVFKQLPQPDELTAWEAILEWRQDEKAQVAFRRLKRWLSNIVAEDKKPKDLEDELRYLIDEYVAYMRLHQIKANTGAIRAVLVQGAQLAENILKMKWGSAAEQFLSFRERRIALLEAEQKAPGREIAYLVEAKRRFGSS